MRRKKLAGSGNESDNSVTFSTEVFTIQFYEMAQHSKRTSRINVQRAFAFKKLARCGLRNSPFLTHRPLRSRRVLLSVTAVIFNQAALSAKNRTSVHCSLTPRLFFPVRARRTRTDWVQGAQAHIFRCFPNLSVGNAGSGLLL